MYNLQESFDFRSIIKDPESEQSKSILYENKISYKKVNSKYNHDQEYGIFKYDKSRLNTEEYQTLGLFRSILVKNGKVVCFSPPKSLVWSDAIDMMDKNTEYHVEQFAEGIMINVFWDETFPEQNEKGKFLFATKSSIHGNVTFFDNGEYPIKKIGDLFAEVCEYVKLDLSILSKKYCYSFVMQHPDYRIVQKVNEPRLTLIAVYEINNDSMQIYNIPLDTASITKYDKDVESGYEKTMIIPGTNVSRLLSYHMNNVDYANVYKKICDISKDITTLTPGLCVSLWNKEGEYVRTKIRDPRYEQIKQLRGNQPKLEYHYLTLRSKNSVIEYLKYYPEHASKFHLYKEKVFHFTRSLFENYRDCYIKKTIDLESCPYQHKTHLAILHKNYMYILRPKGLYINFEYVKQYVNKLHEAQLMFALNYHHRPDHHTSS